MACNKLFFLFLLGITGCVCNLTPTGLTHSTKNTFLNGGKSFVIVASSSESKNSVEKRVNKRSNYEIEKLQMNSFRVESDVKYRYSRTNVISRMANKNINGSEEVTFTVTLPQSAFVSKFSMEIEGIHYEAYVKEKEEAQRVYKQAQAKRKTAGLVEKSAKPSSTFNVNVNIKPASEVTFELTYEELLSREFGHYEQTIDIRPDQISSVEDFEIVVKIQESQNITLLRLLNFRNDEETYENAVGEDNKEAVIEMDKNGRRAIISWKPNTKDQNIFSKRRMSGKFVVQYDMNRESDSGEILMMGGYFVHFFATDWLPVRKHVVFILDTSRSMSGKKMEQMKEAQKRILDSFKADDFFNIVIFNQEIFIWMPNALQVSILSDHRTHTPLAATYENIQKANKIVESLLSDGGTNIVHAVETALRLISTFQQNSLLPTQTESLIVLLTDGELTAVPHVQIQNSIKTANKYLKVPIFSLAFGNENFAFLNELSLQNYGFARKIQESVYTAGQLKGFYNKITSPLLSNVIFNYSSQSEYTISDVTVTRFANVFGGTEIAVAGKLEQNSNSEATHHVQQNHNNHHSAKQNGLVERVDKQFIHASVVGTDHEGTVNFDTPALFCQTNDCSVQIPVANDPHNSHPLHTTDENFLERLWAYLTIQQLTEKYFAASSRADSGIRQKVLQISLKYGFVSQLTSLLIVKPEESDLTIYDGPSNHRLIPRSKSPSREQFAHDSYSSEGGIWNMPLLITVMILVVGLIVGLGWIFWTRRHIIW